MNIPNFKEHVPKIIETYKMCRKEFGKGIVSVCFYPSNGTCSCNFIPEEYISVSVMNSIQNKNFSDKIAYLLFYNNGEQPEDGQIVEVEI